MSQEIFPSLKDDRLSATMLKVAAEWAAEIWPFVEGTDNVAVMDLRIKLMGKTLKKLQDAMPHGKAFYT